MDNEKFQELVLQQFDKVFEKLGSVDNRLDSMESRMESVKKGQLRLESRMESEVINKIGALFDGHSLRGEQIENLKKHFDERFDSIEIDTGYLVSRVARLEKAAK